MILSTFALSHLCNFLSFHSSFSDAFAKLSAVPGVAGGPNASAAANLAALQQLAAVASGRGTNANPQAQQAATVALQLLLHQQRLQQAKNGGGPPGGF